MTTAILPLASLLFAALLFQPRLLKAPLWRATITPLASIIGSGFLVAGPILAHTAGTLAFVAMFALCAVAYLFGVAIRHNILYIEPQLNREPPLLVSTLERGADLALSLASFVSVAYYLNLFAAFGLRLGEIVDPFWIRWASTIAIAGIGTIGAFGGLAALERLTEAAVSLKLSLIGGVVAALAVTTVIAFGSGNLHWPLAEHARGTQEIRVLLGLVILVQGFETSRYLGIAHDAETRVRTMRWAQWISTAIYVTFVLLITRYFRGNLPKMGGETAIIDMLAPLGLTLAPAIIAMALASQLSAAVADMAGGGGLIAELARKRLSAKSGYLIIALAAIAITWTANIYQIIVYASKAFVAYYALQSAQAALSAWRLGQHVRACLFILGVTLALTIIVFAIPATV